MEAHKRKREYESDALAALERGADAASAAAAQPFIPSPTWAGIRRGYYFSCGVQGVGYYADTGLQAVAAASDDAGLMQVQTRTPRALCARVRPRCSVAQLACETPRALTLLPALLARSLRHRGGPLQRESTARSCLSRRSAMLAARARRVQERTRAFAAFLTPTSCARSRSWTRAPCAALW